MAKYKFNFHFKMTALAVAMLCAVHGALALTIDRPSGVVVLGKPLDLTVKVTRSPDEEQDGFCPQADVLFGDNQVESGRVNLVTESASTAEALSLRIRTNNTVDEPVVSLDVRVGCKQPVSRRFVLLSELPSEFQRPVVAPIVKVPPTVLELPVVISVPEVLPSKSVDVAEASDKPVSIVRKKPSISRSTSSASVAAVPRLQLTPIDLSIDWDPMLQATTEMLSLPVEDETKRQEAAALWRYLNLSPKDMLRLSSQEQELNQLKLMMVKSQQQMQDLNQQLQNSENQRYSNPLVYTLGGLLLAMLGGFGYFYRRALGKGAIQSDWWKTANADGEFKPSAFLIDGDEVDSKKQAVLDAERPHQEVSDSPSAKSVAKGVKPKSQANVTNESAPVVAENSEQLVIDDLDFVIDAEPDPTPTSVAVPALSDGYKDFEHSMSASLRSINTHDMLDVRQQAEFFMTLGQYEEAIDLLQNSISHSDDANPLVYLDLLKMLHTLSRRTEFDSIRKNFNRIFSGRVPLYASFNEPSKGLESYQVLCDSIVSTWPMPQSIEFIEASMVRGTDLVASGRLELEAFRDLLMLHAIAKMLNGSEDGADVHTFSAAKVGMVGLTDFADSEPMMLDIPVANDAPVVEASSLLSDQELLLPPTFENPEPAAVDLDLSDNNSNLIDFDPTIFSLDLPESNSDNK